MSMKWFSIKELIRSRTADKAGIDNTPGPEERAALEQLVGRVLDPLREAYGKPINVTSGYRSAALNGTLSGASKRSHHKRGMAADIVGTPNTGAENRRLYDLIEQLGLPYTQRIHEKGTLLNGPAWVHVSLDPEDPRKESLYTLDGKHYRVWPLS